MNRYVNRCGVNPRAMATTAILAVLCLGVSVPTVAQSLQQKLEGTWTLESASENYLDGKRNLPWAAGNMIFDSTGHLSFFLVGRDQPPTSPSVPTPVGPFVAFYGTYTVDEAKKVLTLKIDHATSPLFNSAVRTAKISFDADVMTWTGSEVKTPEGLMTPINQWKPAK